MWVSLDPITKVIAAIVMLVIATYVFSTIKRTISKVYQILYTLIKKMSPFFKKLKRIEYKGGSISLTSDSDKTDQDTAYSSHRNCPKYADILEFFAAQRKLDRDINRIQERETLQDQMKEADRRIEDLLNSAEDLFAKVIQSNNSSADIFACKEYRAYKGVLELLKEKVTIKIRIMCRENHFAEKSESEFSAYVKMQNSLIQSYIKEKVSFYFPYGSNLSGYDRMEDMYDLISDSITAFLYDARSISLSKIEKIKMLEEEFESKFSNMV